MNSLTEKVLSTTKKYGKFNRSVAKVAFKGRLANAFDKDAYLHGSIMRTARKLESEGLLSRKNGNFVIAK